MHRYIITRMCARMRLMLILLIGLVVAGVYGDAPCDPGMYQGPEGCAPCSPGTYNALVGASSCMLCPAGTFQSNAEATECVPCHVGWFCPADGLSNALQCARDTYSWQVGSTRCPRCPHGTTRPGGPSTAGCIDAAGDEVAAYPEEETDGYNTPTNPNTDKPVIGMAMGLVIGIVLVGILLMFFVVFWRGRVTLFAQRK